MAIKAILFDFWGTLVENGIFPSPVRQVKRLLVPEMDFSEYIQKFEKAFMTKEFSDLNEAFKEVCSEFSIAPTKEILDNLVGLWNRNKLFAKPYMETKKVLEHLRGKTALILVSNTDCFSVNDVIDKYGLDKYFDSIFLSYKEGLLKTDPELFKKVLEVNGLKNDEVLMVGDSLESDVKAAENAGIKAVLIDRRGRRNYELKISNLDELERYL